MAAYIGETAAEAAGVGPQSVRIALRPARTYQSNLLYDAYAGGRHLIVKEFLKPEEFDGAPLREFEGLHLLAPLDIAPQPLLWRPWAPDRRPLVVYEFMAGEMWDRRRPSGEELEKLAALWLVVNDVTAERLWISHGFDTPLRAQMATLGGMFRRYADWAQSAFPAGVRAAEMCQAVLRRREAIIGELESGVPPLFFCRADARFANVIARPHGRLGMVDWEDCGLRDPAVDLADIIMAPNQEDLLTWADWQPFLRPYLDGHAKRDPGLEHRLHLYLALFPLNWLGWLLRAGVTRAGEGNVAGWMIHSMPANEKLRRYLARAHAWPDLDIRVQLEALQDVRFFPES